MERKRNVAEIKKLFQERKQTAEMLHHFTRFLIAKGISQAVAEEITADFSLKNGKLNSLKERLAKQIRTTGEISFPNRLVFIGPTGVGKTTTLLKLAKHYQKQGKQVAVSTLDPASVFQLSCFSKEWNIPFFKSAKEASGELILVDTEGCNFYLPNRIDELGERLSELGKKEILLTLSATAKSIDLYGAIHQFSALSPNSLIFTKLDETLASGVLVNVSVKTDFPIRYIAYGYPLPGEVCVANSYEIMRKILTDFNNEEFNHLRQLSLDE